MKTTAMARDDIRKMIQDILADLLDDESLTITDATTAEDVADWDSIVQVKLLLAVEAEMGFRFSIAEAEHLANVGQFVDLIGKKAGG
jgi:acyl carrier protein